MRFMFAGRPVREKGGALLREAWDRADLGGCALVIAGGERPWAAQPGGAGVLALGRLTAEEMRDVYSGCEVLVVPSLATASFREPWGLVVNEAMNRGLAVIASDAVGAAAGGLVRDGETGLVVPAGDAAMLAGAMERLAGDRELRERLGTRGRAEVAAYSHEAWAEAFSRALASVGASRGRW
jgi:glycosyltransferase involved in cell wall biosynthesis